MNVQGWISIPLTMKRKGIVWLVPGAMINTGPGTQHQHGRLKLEPGPESTIVFRYISDLLARFASFLYFPVAPESDWVPAKIA